MNILIPCCYDEDYLNDCLESLASNSVLKNKIIVLAEKGKVNKELIKPFDGIYEEVDFKDGYKAVEHGIRKYESDDGYILIGNADLLFAKNWDVNLMRAAEIFDAKVLNPGLIMPLKSIGWNVRDCYDYENNGVSDYSWTSRDRLSLNKDDFYKQAEKLKIEYRGQNISVRSFIPLIMKKSFMLELLKDRSYYDIGDIELEKMMCERNILKLTVLDSIVYHYAGVSYARKGKQ